MSISISAGIFEPHCKGWARWHSLSINTSSQFCLFSDMPLLSTHPFLYYGQFFCFRVIGSNAFWTKFSPRPQSALLHYTISRGSEKRLTRVTQALVELIKMKCLVYLKPNVGAGASIKMSIIGWKAVTRAQDLNSPSEVFCSAKSRSAISQPRRRVDCSVVVRTACVSFLVPILFFFVLLDALLLVFFVLFLRSRALPSTLFTDPPVPLLSARIVPIVVSITTAAGPFARFNYNVKTNPRLKVSKHSFLCARLMGYCIFNLRVMVFFCILFGLCHHRGGIVVSARQMVFESVHVGFLFVWNFGCVVLCSLLSAYNLWIPSMRYSNFLHIILEFSACIFESKCWLGFEVDDGMAKTDFSQFHLWCARCIISIVIASAAGA